MATSGSDVVRTSSILFFGKQVGVINRLVLQVHEQMKHTGSANPNCRGTKEPPPPPILDEIVEIAPI